jgi:AcrR family transcriptional regulator
VPSDSRPERTRDAARTKQRLLDAARDEFAEYGIAGGRVERIAAAARCNKAMIYRYFDGKDALFDAAFAAHVTAHLDRVNFDATDLPAYAGRLFDVFEDDPAVIRLASWYRLERSGSPGLAAVTYANQTRLGKLRQAQSEGNLTDRWDATAILVLVQSIAGAWATLNPEFSTTSAPDRAKRRLAVIDAVTRLVASH